MAVRDCCELGAGCSLSVPPTALAVQGFGFHTLPPPHTQGAFPEPSSSVFPNLEVQACSRSCSASGRHSLELWDRLAPEGSAPSVAIPAAAGAALGLGLSLLRPCGHHSSPSFGLAHP